MNKFYRLNCPVCGEFIGIDVQWSIGTSRTRVVLPEEAVIMHDGLADHRVYFPLSKGDEAVSRPQGGRRSNRRSAIA